MLPTDYYSVKLSFGLKLCIFLALFKVEAHFVVISFLLGDLDKRVQRCPYSPSAKSVPNVKTYQGNE